MARKRREAPKADEQMVTVFGAWREASAGATSGWVSVKARLPVSVLEQYALEVSQPDLRGVTVGKLVTQLERHAMDGGE